MIRRDVSGGPSRPGRRVDGGPRCAAASGQRRPYSPPPQWHADAGPISLHYANRTSLPAKTRVFVDFIVEPFRRDPLAERFTGSRD
jgi:hypothetical protein